MMKWLNLVRWQNLGIVILVFSVFRFNFLEPFNVATSLSGFQYFLLMFSVMCIMAGGNIINDIYDKTADRINKPGKNLIGIKIPEKRARVVYWVFSITGMLLGYFMGYTVGITMLGGIHLIAFFLLWMYSTDFKHRPLLGNFVVSLLASLVILCVVLFDVIPANQDLVRTGEYNNLLLIFLGYAIFAFVTTFIREIIKDAQDVKGDKRIGGKTLPVLASAKVVKTIIVVLQVLLALSLLAIAYYFRNSISLVLYISILVVVPIAISAYSVTKAKGYDNWGLASKLMKLVMVSGILSVVVFTYA